MKEEIQFRLGDSVYFPYHGYGTIIGLHNDGREYPIEVRWEASPHGQEVNTFTKDGFLTHGWAEWNVPSDSKLRNQLTVVDKSPLKKAEEMAEESKFKVGDRVFYPYYGMGTVIANYKADERTFPIEVQWDHSPTNYPVSTFTKEGLAAVPIIEDAGKVKLVLSDSVSNEETGGSEMGQIAGVINHNAAKKQDAKSIEEDKKFMAECIKIDEESEKFKVGDRVFSFYYGFGIVEKIFHTEINPYPVVVRWAQNENDAAEPNTCNYYTMDGQFFTDGSEGKRDIYPLEVISKKDHNPWMLSLIPLFDKEDDEGTVERMEDGLNKKVEDAINPSHYKVEGLPEAIDIINHLMHREQLEGFLWGNILKYAYRYGRKGDKAETAGKIAWYATQLKELEEEKGERK